MKSATVITAAALFAALPFASPVLATEPTTAPKNAGAESSISGEDEFQRYCALCHGRDGRGLGPVSDAMTRPAADLTLIAKRNDGVFPFDKVADTVRNGGGIAEHSHSRMPAWGKLFRDSDTAHADAIILEVTKYIQSLQER